MLLYHEYTVIYQYFQEVYEIKPLERKVLASSICRHDVGDQAIMNGCSVYDGRNHLFAAGLDDECHVFSLKYRVTSPQKKSKGRACITCFDVVNLLNSVNVLLFHGYAANSQTIVPS